VELVIPKLNKITNSILDKCGQKTPLIYCWRGGARSNSLAHLLSNKNPRTHCLIGGYKAFRRYVMTYLNETTFPFTFISLYGLTGVGKTDLLQKLAQRGWPVLNLEGLANHKGSTFGHLGEQPQPTQKNFDALLFDQLRKIGGMRGNAGMHRNGGMQGNEGMQKCRSPRFILVEGESQKIGRLNLSKAFMNSLNKSKKILITAPMDSRVNRLLEIYTKNGSQSKEMILESVSRIQARLGGLRTQTLIRFIEKNELPSAISFLLTEYYDKLYQHSNRAVSEYEFAVDNNGHESVEKVEGYLNELSQVKGTRLQIK